mmetsp:Transcript_77568/g.179834  ORF Transcript_77568/g.179834 Transcript_77568/m.179834 type:complete len:195 (+) Transcript_77568:71-655(+)
MGEGMSAEQVPHGQGVAGRLAADNLAAATPHARALAAGKEQKDETLDGIAMITGSSYLEEDAGPYGCGAKEVDVRHRPVEGEMANVARSLYYTRRIAEGLAHDQRAPQKIQKYAADVAKYSHELEFFSRQLGLAMKMPIMVNPPYLPVDLAQSPLEISLAGALAAPRRRGVKARGIARSCAPWCRGRPCLGDFI